MTPLEALQTALEAEHAALHVLGVLGARTSRSAQPELYAAVSDAYAAHRARRDQLRSLVRDGGGTPVAAETAYELPAPLRTPGHVTRAALELERRCATTYAWLVANTVGEDRAWAVRALTSTAVRELTFRGSPEIFPGAGEYADG
jgi:hypothetical protein